ncbi:MAG: 16S rRNA (uracil(1498)-N(3))-methyltransferase [Syntrophomonadaceae bacterium]
MHRIFVSPDNIDTVQFLVSIDEEQAHHLEKVLRLKTGDQVVAFDGTGNEYTLTLRGRVNGILMGAINNTRCIADTSVNLALVQGIAKGDKMDTIVQKAVEIGVSTIYPVSTQYSVVKLDQVKAQKKVSRWQTIAREACKQCRRNRVPEIKPVMSLQSSYAYMQNSLAVMLYEQEKDNRLKHILKSNWDNTKQELFLLIGPEGGFSADEVNEARAKGILTASLGRRILRTETASLVAASIVMYELGDLG